MKRVAAQTYLLVIFTSLAILVLVYLAVFGRALRQPENHLGIFLTLPSVFFTDVARVDESTYLSKNSNAFVSFMEQQGYVYVEQLGSGHFFEKNGEKYLAVSRMYSSFFLVFTLSQPDEPLLGGDRDEHGCIGSAGYSWCASANKCLRPWEEVCAGELNFFETGVAVKEAAKTNGENLFILYEKPGQPALRKSLKFDEKSLCGDERQQIVCLALSVSDYGLTNGTEIEVRGLENGEVVTVRKLMIIKKQD